MRNLPLDRYIVSAEDRVRVTGRFSAALVDAAKEAANDLSLRKGKRVSFNEFMEAAIQMAVDLQTEAISREGRGE